jgi:hypothetical protein
LQVSEAAATVAVMAKKKPDLPPDPDRVLRESAGTYRTEDGRFELRQGGVGWYLIDSERTNELGQELLHGPFGTLKEARNEIPAARKVVQLAGPKPRPVKTLLPSPQPAPPPKTWIDHLPESEQADVRRLIKALGRAGIAHADALVKDARGSSEPLIAKALIERRLTALVDEASASDRNGRRDLIRRVIGILADDGLALGQPLPNWELVERDAERERPRRLRPTI